MEEIVHLQPQESFLAKLRTDTRNYFFLLTMFVLQQCNAFVSCGDNSQAWIYKGISKIKVDTMDVRSATTN